MGTQIFANFAVVFAAVWTADGTNEASIKNIGSKIRSTLSLPNDQPLVYELHEDSVNKHTKPKYTM